MAAICNQIDANLRKPDFTESLFFEISQESSFNLVSEMTYFWSSFSFKGKVNQSLEAAEKLSKIKLFLHYFEVHEFTKILERRMWFDDKLSWRNLKSIQLDT